MQKTRLLLVAGLLCAAPLAAQQKRPLTVSDFDRWRAIEGATLSRDGAWAVYSLVPQVGEGEVVVRRVPGGPEFRHTRGFVGRPQTQPGVTGRAFTPPEAQVTADSRFVVFTIEPPRDEYERARRQRKKPAEMPRASLGIMSLPGGQVTVIPRVRSFRLAKESGRFLAYLLESRDSAAAPAADSAARPAAAAATPGGTPRPVSSDTTRRDDRKKKETGSVLVLRDLSTGAETRIEDVTGYALDDRGRWLGYTVATRDGRGDGAFVHSLTDGRTHPLLTGEGNYRSLAFDRAGTQAAFLSDRDEFPRKEARYALYHAALRTPREARRVVGPADAGAGLQVSEQGTVRFTRDGGAVLFGAASPPLDSIPADSLADKAVFDLWHYRDPRLQPQQRVEASRDRDRSYAAVYRVGAGRHRVVGNDTLRQVSFSEDGRVALATTTLPYAVEAMWGEGGTDAYVVDVASGSRRLVARRLPFAPVLSADGRYVLYFDRDRRWHAHEVATGRARDLTGALAGVRFDQETWDTPDLPAPYGVAGWTEGDRSVLLYDRFDVWEVDPAGRRAPRVVTDSVGRRGRLVFRVVDLDPDEESIDPARPLLLRVVDSETKATGFWRDRLGVAAAPVQLVMEHRQMGTPSRARNADVFLFTRSTARDFPDLWVSDSTFAGAAKVSEANPQQAEFRWTTAELVRWRSNDGVELKGILYRPEDFDPSRRYPLVVYFYEQFSDNLHQHQVGVPRNIIQPTLYASNGYLVFMPDIHYTPGYPGESALKSIVPGVQMLIDRGSVDPRRVGIQGQSWGGYQTAYMITRTPMFAAAMAGAPVANMTSAYGGIRWESGLARAFQYERGQSRIGGSLWEMPWRYIENSPLFAADRVTTPLLIMHNDADGAVPWYQGIEMFVALRRFGKEVYLINYNGDAHNPTKRANQLDIARRMLQFFDHHLRGAAAPEWMRRGIPFLQKGRDQMTSPQPEVPVTAAPAAGVQAPPAPATP
ncbi:MAG TPA: prolyl oligopeptidase family serine peptidase [Longimicrobiaceae bacterium]|nr:prolyl oligopeptidase family serine peptidase [Longimicrobiaceae bacterium]